MWSLTNIYPYLRARPRRSNPTFNKMTGVFIPHAKHPTKKKKNYGLKRMLHNIIYHSLTYCNPLTLDKLLRWTLITIINKLTIKRWKIMGLPTVAACINTYISSPQFYSNLLFDRTDLSTLRLLKTLALI